MSNYPTVRPSLTLDFQKSKQLDPRISFSRASSATYVEGGVIKTADEHQARFEDKGLLIEEARTNYAENSEDFSLWTAQNSTVLTAQGTAPNGTNTAFKIQENTSNISHSIREPTNSTWSGAATMSCYVKPAGRNFAFMGFTGVSQTSVTFDLVNKVSSYKGNNVTSASVEEAENGWVKIIAVFSSSITSGRATVGPAESDSGGGLNYVGDGSSGILAWGAQLEAGSFPTSYIPTAGSTVTRAADVAQITGDNFSSWYNQTEGTMFVSMSDGVRSDLGANLYGSHSGDRIIMLASSNSRFRYQTNGRYTPSWTNVNIYSANDVRAAGPMKYAYAYKPYDYALSVKGSTLTDTQRDPQPNVITLKLGQETTFGGNSRPNAAISRISFYPERLTNAQLEAITS